MTERKTYGFYDDNSKWIECSSYNPKASEYDPITDKDEIIYFCRNTNCDNCSNNLGITKYRDLIFYQCSYHEKYIGLSYFESKECNNFSKSDINE